MKRAWVDRYHLLWIMVRREILGRYQGSVMGVVWSLLHPLLLLTAYTFVFAVVLSARWPGVAAGDNMSAALMIFVGLIAHGVVAECLHRSPLLIPANVNYVKRVVFPLELLPPVPVIVATFQALVSAAILLCVQALVKGSVPGTALLLPFVMLPLVFFALGLSWWLASVAVYLRDIGQLSGLLSNMLLFLSPIFYPLENVPEGLRVYLLYNPLAFLIDELRKILYLGLLPNWTGLAIATVVGGMVAMLGLRSFRRLRRGFADVL